MTKTVVGSFSVQPQIFPAGTVASGYRLMLTEAGGAIITGTAGLDASAVSIGDVPVGTWSGSIALLDANGLILGSAVAAASPIVVEPDAPATVTLQVPSSLTLS